MSDNKAAQKKHKMKISARNRKRKSMQKIRSDPDLRERERRKRHEYRLKNLDKMRAKGQLYTKNYRIRLRAEAEKRNFEFSELEPEMTKRSMKYKMSRKTYTLDEMGTIFKDYVESGRAIKLEQKDLKRKDMCVFIETDPHNHYYLRCKIQETARYEFIYNCIDANYECHDTRGKCGIDYLYAMPPGLTNYRVISDLNKNEEYKKALTSLSQQEIRSTITAYQAILADRNKKKKTK